MKRLPRSDDQPMPLERFLGLLEARKLCVHRSFSSIHCTCVNILGGTCMYRRALELIEEPTARASAEATLDYHERRIAETSGCRAGAFPALDCDCVVRPGYPERCPRAPE